MRSTTLAGDIAKHALERPTEAKTLSAAAIAIDAARSTVKRTIAAGHYAPDSPGLVGRTTNSESVAAD